MELKNLLCLSAFFLFRPRTTMNNWHDHIKQTQDDDVGKRASYQQSCSEEESQEERDRSFGKLAKRNCNKIPIANFHPGLPKTTATTRATVTITATTTF